MLVVVLHGQPMLRTRLFEHGYLMVDLFFLMSGFVLSAGYGARLAEGRAAAWFAQKRLLRLYPLAFLGLTLGAFAEAFGVAQGPLLPMPHWSLILALGAVFLPWLGGGLVAPFDGPTWSLQLEFWINLAYGAVAPCLTNRRLMALTALSGLALVIVSLRLGQYDGGFANHDASRGAGDFGYLVGWARVGFSFPLGVLLHRLWRDGDLSGGATRSAQWLVPASLFLVAFAPPIPSPLFDLMIVGGIFPTLLILAVRNEPTGGLARLSQRLGGWSYGLYALHGPIFVFLHCLEPRDAGLPVRLGYFACGMAASILTAAAAERWIDAPVRRWAARRASSGALLAPA